MSRLERLDDFTSTEAASFQKICRKLLKMTFIVREKNDEHRRDFNFIKNNQQTFSEYFRIIVCVHIAANTFPTPHTAQHSRLSSHRR